MGLLGSPFRFSPVSSSLTILMSSFAISRATLYHRHFTHPSVYDFTFLRLVFHAHFTHLKSPHPLSRSLFFHSLSIDPPLDSSLHWCLGIGSSLGLGSVFVSGLWSLAQSLPSSSSFLPLVTSSPMLDCLTAQSLPLIHVFFLTSTLSSSSSPFRTVSVCTCVYPVSRLVVWLS